MDYDAFLSHHSADKPLIRELRRRLMAQDLRVWNLMAVTRRVGIRASGDRPLPATLF